MTSGSCIQSSTSIPSEILSPPLGQMFFSVLLSNLSRMNTPELMGGFSSGVFCSVMLRF
jgi:hypothetical protein